MENFALQTNPCSFLKLRISPWEVLIPFLPCSSSLSALSLHWRLLSFFSTKRRSFSLSPSLCCSGPARSRRRHAARALERRSKRWWQRRGRCAGAGWAASGRWCTARERAPSGSPAACGPGAGAGQERQQAVRLQAGAAPGSERARGGRRRGGDGRAAARRGHRAEASGGLAQAERRCAVARGERRAGGAGAQAGAGERELVKRAGAAAAAGAGRPEQRRAAIGRQKESEDTATLGPQQL
jgi:hypothetical protein